MPDLIAADESSARGGLSAVVKDVIDLAGQVTGAANPTWAATHDPAVSDATCIARLRAAGVRIAGKATCAEFAYSLSGDNAHFGMPLNAAAPDRNPGGSSSGPAAAVAAATCDIGVGTDTLGSVRIPASYCGLFGYRPSYGLVDTAGVLHLARSFDTVGLLTASGPVLHVAANALLDDGEAPSAPRVHRLRGVADAFALADAIVRPSLDAALHAVVEALGCNLETVAAFGDESGFTHGLDVFSTVQGFEVWQQFGEWIESHHPDFGPGVAERFARAASVTREAYEAACRARETIRAQVLDLLDGDVLALPTTGGLAPLRSAGADELQRVRIQAGRMSCLASLAGCPSISLPAAPVGGAPVGLALVGAPGADRRLLEIAARWPRPAPTAASG